MAIRPLCHSEPVTDVTGVGIRSPSFLRQISQNQPYRFVQNAENQKTPRKTMYIPDRRAIINLSAGVLLLARFIVHRNKTQGGLRKY